MTIAIITGSGGLIGSEAAVYFARLGFDVVGIDNDLRRTFFGAEASTLWKIQRLKRDLGARYVHLNLDIRERDAIKEVFARYGSVISLVLHAAAQPSHDWAATDPFTDFDVNATGTLNLLEACRQHSPDAPFVFASTNKVYGDRPNGLPLQELAMRWEINPTHRYAHGIAEDMPIDASMHSLFGVSKASADLLVQEYGRYFGMPTACFRGGCLTGPAHSGTRLHGFLSYLLRCAATGQPYDVYGFGGKQVRDNLHSADFVRAVHEFTKAPRSGEVYNMGGGTASNCSMLEAIDLCQDITGRELDWTYRPEGRVGDHVWYVSDTTKFRMHYPDWHQDYDVPLILKEMYETNIDRWIEAQP